MTCYSRVLSFYNAPLRNRITCYFILCVFLLGFTSCDGFFETEIKIDPPDFDELIAIHSFLDADRDSTALILVSISQGIFEQRSLDKLLNDAEVRVFSENSELQVMTREVDHFSSRPFANFRTESYDFQTGNQVDITVSIDGNEGAFVSQKIPGSVVPDSVVLVRNAGISLDGRRSGLDIYFQDPPGEAGPGAFPSLPPPPQHTSPSSLVASVASGSDSAGVRPNVPHTDGFAPGGFPGGPCVPNAG